LPDWAHTLLFLIGSAALMLLLGCRSELPTWLLTDILLVPLYGMVIFGAARMAGYGTRLLSVPGLVLLGEASYSVYILHTSVVFWWHRLTEKVLAIRLSGTAEVVIIFALVIGFSVLVFARFERPARRWILQYATRPHKIAPLQA
jgi:peptidoglycan/LPS O-acetylase OafA/YrhL